MNEVALIYRKRIKGRQSIEGLFEPIDNLSIVNRIELPYELNSFINALKLLFFALRIKERCIHITGDVHYMSIFLFWKRIIITMHDANHFEDMSGFRKKIYSLIWFKLPLLLADKIIFISPFAAEQMKAHFKIQESKVEIIPNTFRKITKRKVQKEKNFTILIIGTKPNKNLSRLIIAIKELDNIKLLIVGKLSNKDKELLAEHSVLHQNFFNISNEKLEELYNISDMLFFASTKEGFGLPILEAQSCGLPVLTSNTTSMPYVAGDAALIIDPFDVMKIKQSVLLIKDDMLLRESLIKKGYKNVKRFNENSFVSSYLNIYKTL